MKKLIFVFIILFTVGAVYAATRPKQLRITAGDATNPQTFSFQTLHGTQANSWTAIATDGGATLKFKGIGSHGNWWLYLPTGATFTMSPDLYPVDSLTVLRDATSSGFYFVGMMGSN